MSQDLGLVRRGIDRVFAVRDRLLASARFQRLASRLPGTRWIARRRARAVFDLCAGFVYSQVLLACVRLGLFELLIARPREIAEISRRIDLPLEATERLLKAAISLRLLERRGADRYGLGPLGAAVVGNRAVESMIEHHPLLYEDLRDPIELLRGRSRDLAMSRYWPYATAREPRALRDEDVGEYSRLMSESQTLIAEQVLDRYPVASHRKLLDVGGGQGAFLAAAAARAPGLQLALFDLPAVAARARLHLAQAGIAERVAIVGGDFFCDPLPDGADLVTLIRILHDHDDERVLELLRAVREAIDRDGTLLIAEPMAGTPGAEPVGDAYFAFYLLAMGTGRARTSDEIGQLLERSGFSHIEMWPTAMPLQTRLISARPV